MSQVTGILGAIGQGEPHGSESLLSLTSDELCQQLERSDVRTLVVTTPGGVLLGVVRRDDILT